MIDIEKIKQKIMEFLKKGPSLPVRISKQTELSPMFTSAILSELTNEKKIKISNLKVGSSPLYFLPGDEKKLEDFAENNLTGIKKEAFLKIKNQKIIEDRSQTPAIRVALRSIEDFAIPIKSQDNLFWKYTFIPQEEAEKLLNKKKTPEPVALVIKDPVKGGLDNSEDGKLGGHIQRPQKKITPIFQRSKPKPKKTRKPSQNFLEEIKPFLEENQIQILELEEVNKRKVIARVYIKNQPHILAAFNKKRLTETDILNIYKKANSFDIPYYILIKDEPTKKISQLMEAYKKLRGIGKLE